MYQEGTDHLIWSNYDLDLEDWRDSLEELYPHYSEDELYEKMYDSNAANLDDERCNLNIQLSSPILVIGDLGLWYGRRTGYKEIDSGNIRDCLYSDTDYTTWYVDKCGELRCDAVHHDGTNHYRYRAYRDGVTDEQIEDAVLDKLNIGDIKLSFDEDGLVATDGYNNVWRGKQFYAFLVEDAISYDEYGKPNEISGELLKGFAELCGHNGVEVKDYRAPSPWDEYEKAKKENPDAVVMQKIGDFFEIFGETDTKIAHEVLDLIITKRTFENKSISTPMCGFPV